MVLIKPRKFLNAEDAEKRRDSQSPALRDSLRFSASFACSALKCILSGCGRAVLGISCHPSLCRYPKYLQYPLQLLVAEKGDFHRPLALRIGRASCRERVYISVVAVS